KASVGQCCGRGNNGQLRGSGLGQRSSDRSSQRCIGESGVCGGRGTCQRYNRSGSRRRGGSGGWQNRSLEGGGQCIIDHLVLGLRSGGQNGRINSIVIGPQKKHSAQTYRGDQNNTT